MFIVVDGVDGAGKDTLADVIIDKLVSYNHFVTKYSFPIRDKFIDRHLKGEEDMSHKLFQEACLRQREEYSPYFEENFKGVKDRHAVVVRWTPSGVCYNTLDCLKDGFTESHHKIMDYHIKVHENICKPDIGILLKCSPDKLFARFSGRGKLEKYEVYDDILKLNDLFEDYYIKSNQYYLMFDTTNMAPEYYEIIATIVVFTVFSGSRDVPVET